VIGNNPKGIAVITGRDRTLLNSLVLYRMVDRDQAMQVAGFQTIGVANKRLLKLVRAGLIKRFFMPTDKGGMGSIYALTGKAIQLLGAETTPIRRQADAVLTTDLFAVHQLAINSVLLEAKRPNPKSEANRLLTFRSALSKSIPLVPDAYFELVTPSGIHPMFLEIDLGNESLKVIEEKVRRYFELATSGEYERIFKHLRFRVLFVASSERRLGIIRRMVAKNTNKLFWFSTLNAIKSEGLLAPIWFRPEGSERQPLL
jgi:Replication-relaxation